MADEAPAPKKKESAAPMRRLLSMREGNINGIARINHELADWLNDVFVPAVVWTSTPTPVQHSLWASMIRLLAWLGTMGKCNGEDHQAAAAAARASFEILADVVLLDSTPGIVQQLLDWEDSASLKYIERLKRLGVSLDQPLLDFESQHRTAIEATRLNRWPKTDKKTGKTEGTHPNRWYEPKMKFETVIESHRTVLGDETVSLLLQHYTMMNWLIHASGHAGLRWSNKEAIQRTAAIMMSIPPRVLILCEPILRRHFTIKDGTPSPEKQRKEIETARSMMNLADLFG